MLKQFRVDPETAVLVQGDNLKATVAAIFESLGVPPEDALLGADVLVLADLRGVDTHGVSNMMRSYVHGYQRGEINPCPDWRIIRESPSTANIDSASTDLTAALTTLRSQAQSFGSSLSTVQIRQDFTKAMINTLQTGADNLTLADSNEEGANLLALQTRQQLSTTALSLASQASQAVLRLFQ